MLERFQNITSRELTSLGLIASVDLAFQGIGSQSLTNLIDWLIVTAAIGISTGWFGQTVGEIIMWILYTVALYTLIPTLFPDSASDLAEDRILLLLVALGAVVIARALTTIFSPLRTLSVTGTSIGGTGLSLWQVFAPLVLGYMMLVILYLWFGRTGKILGEGSTFRKLLEERQGETIQIAVDSPETSIADKYYFAMGLLTLTSLFMFLAVILGGIVASLSVLYPIPELLFIGIAVATKFNGSVDRWQIPKVTSMSTDFEEDFGKTGFTILQSRKGMGIGFAIFMTLILVVLLLFQGLNGIRRTISIWTLEVDIVSTWSGNVPAAIEPFAHYSIAGATITILVSALCLLWGWGRIIRRGPAFIDNWERQGENVPGSHPAPEISRPAGGVIFPVFLAATALPAFQPAMFGTGNYPIQAIYGAVWPLGVVIAGFWVRNTLRRSPQPASSDNWVYGSSFVLVSGYLSLFLGSIQFSPIILLLIPMVFLIIYLLPDLNRGLEQKGGYLSALSELSWAVLLIPMSILALLPMSPNFILWVCGFFGLLVVMQGLVEIRDGDRSASLPVEFVHEYESNLGGSEVPTRILIVEREVPDAVKGDVHQAFADSREQWQALDEDPRVPTVEDTSNEPRPWLAVETVDGSRLSDAHDRLSLAKRQTVIIAVAEAVEDATNHGIFYREIKPEHIWVQERNEAISVTVDDWGLERACRVAGGSDQPTPFTAPELSDNPEHETEQCVVYTLGALSYFALTGRPPTTEGTDTADQRIAPPNHYVPELYSEVANIVLTALAQDPANRYETVSEFRQAIVAHRSETDTDETDSPAEQTVSAGQEQAAGAAGRTAHGLLEQAATDDSPQFTRRKTMSMLGVGGFGIAGYIHPLLGGANDPILPDRLEYAFHSRTGTLQWAFEADDTVANAPAVADGIVYAGSWDGNLYALSSSSGAQKWRFKPEMATQVYSPTLSNGLVFVRDNTRTLYALDADSGSKQWQVDSAGTSPVAVDNTIYLGGYNSASALDIANGTTIWRQDLKGASAPTVAAGTAYFGGEKGIYAFDASTGQQEWMVETGNPTGSTAIVNDTLYVGTGYDIGETSRLYALNPQNGTKRWMFETERTIASRPVAGDGSVYVSFLNSIRALDGSDGTEQWRYDKREARNKAPTYANGTLYFGSFDGNVYAIDGTSGTEQWSFSGGGIMGESTVAGDYLFIGSDANRLFAIAINEL